MRTFAHLVGIFLLAILPCSGEEKESACVSKNGVRLGIAIAKPDPTSTANQPSLPEGVGFVVLGVEENGPADRGGVEKLDLLWKFDDQMLVNQGQLATLLRLSKMGDEVSLSVFRNGKPHEMKVKLEEGKGGGLPIDLKGLSEAVEGGSRESVRLIDAEGKKATYTDGKGTAEVYRGTDGDNVKIVGPGGEVIFEGVTRTRSDLSVIPEEWRRQVCALRRGLYHVADCDKKSTPISEAEEVPASSQE